MSDIQLLTKLIKVTAPIMNGNAFQIKTTQTERCCAEIVSWLQVGIIGGFILGPTRHGKTAAIRWTLKALRELLAIPLTAFEIPVRSQSEAHEGDFFSYLLQSVRHRDWMTGTVNAKRNRFIDFLTTRARTSPIKTVILFFDEAQFLKDRHWEWLLNVSNEASVRHIKVFFLFCGPPELAEARENYVARGLSQLVGRFMSVVFELTGLTSQTELEQCLQRFSDVVYPRAQRQPLISHFVDSNVYPDFLLASYAPDMWNAFLETRAVAAYPHEDSAKSFVLPMHYVTAAILNFLTNLAINRNVNVTVATLLSQAVTQCGFSDFVRSTVYEPRRGADGHR